MVPNGEAHSVEVAIDVQALKRVVTSGPTDSVDSGNVQPFAQPVDEKAERGIGAC